MLDTRPRTKPSAARLPSQPLLSVIVPVLNEGDGLARFLSALQPIKSAGNEIIIVDGGSEDASVALLEGYLRQGLISSLIRSAKGRARQMNEGAKTAQGELLLFLHADTRLPQSALASLRIFTDQGGLWGRFDVQLDNAHWSFRMISWFINQRSRLTGIATGDQGIFVRRDIFEQLGGYPEQPLMEDIELSCRLKKQGRPFCITDPVLTSARKWQQHGTLRTIWLMWRLRASYALGVAPEILVKQYYPTSNSVSTKTERL